MTNAQQSLLRSLGVESPVVWTILNDCNYPRVLSPRWWQLWKRHKAVRWRNRVDNLIFFNASFVALVDPKRDLKNFSKYFSTLAMTENTQLLQRWWRGFRENWTVLHSTCVVTVGRRDGCGVAVAGIWTIVASCRGNLHVNTVVGNFNVRVVSRTGNRVTVVVCVKCRLFWFGKRQVANFFQQFFSLR